MVKRFLLLTTLLSLAACNQEPGHIADEFGLGSIIYSTTASRISTSSSNVIADLVDQATVDVRLIDIDGHGVPFIFPLITATGTLNSNEYALCSMTDGNGNSTCTFTSSKAETKTVMLVSPIQLTGNSVTFVAGPADSVKSTIIASGTTVADGATLTTISITLLDTFDNPIPNQTPAFSATDTGPTNTLNVCTLSDAQGLSTCSMSSTKAEVKTLLITSPVAGVTSGTVSFIAGAAAIANSSISGTGPVFPDGTSQSTISITLQDAFLNPLVGTVPTFTATGAGNTTEACTPINGSGTSTCHMESTVAQLKTLSIATPIAKAGGTVLFRTDISSVASDITPASFNEDVTSIITLVYSDVEGDLADACYLSNLQDITIVQACACDGAGVCTVGVRGTTHFNGTASFDYMVHSYGSNSNTATATLTIDPINDIPSMTNPGTQSTAKNTNSNLISIVVNDVDDTLICGTSLSMVSSDGSVVDDASVTFAGTAPNCTAEVAPETDATGTVNLDFIVNDGNGGSTSETISFSVNGAHLVFLDTGTIITSLNFGTPGMNASRTLQLRNNGNQSSGAIATFITGSVHFDISGNGCGAALGAGGSCFLTVDWIDAATGGSGTMTGNIQATYSNPAGSDTNIPLSGTR